MAKKDKKDKKEAQAEEEPKKKGGFLKILIIIILALLIGAGGGVAVYMFVFKKPSQPAVGPQNQTLQTKQAVAPPVVKRNEILPQIDLNPFIVNLADRNARRYLKVKISLEVSEDKTKEEIKKRTPEIRDIITLLLSSKTYNDISTFDGKLALKTEIMKRINAILINGRVTNVYFVDFVVQ